MDLSQEERKKIYEEEKARLEGQAQAEKEKSSIPSESSTSLAPRVAGLLCYLGVWITGIVFIVIEQKNKWVRFHAAQSLVTFGTLWVAGMILGNIPYIKFFFSPALGILGVILWIVLMVKAYNGEKFKLPFFGDIAEMIVGTSGQSTNTPPPAPPVPPAPSTAPAQPQMIGVFPPSQPAAPPAASVVPPAPPPGNTAPPPPSSSSSLPPAPAFVEVDGKTRRKIDAWFSHRHEGRITGSAFAIAFNVILLVFFNAFNQYIAYYNGETVNGIINWTRQPFFTSDIGLWLPILNATLVISIICHIIMILIDRDVLRQALHVIMNGFALATIVTLLKVYPFDFSVIPNHAAETGANLGVTISLIIVAVGTGIGLLVGFIKLLISSAKALFKAV
jgi:uncharacterized membrane protein